MAEWTLSVDRDECEANALCVGIAPDVFELHDDDVVHVRVEHPPADRLQQVQNAVDTCPKRALFLTRGDAR